MTSIAPTVALTMAETVDATVAPNILNRESIKDICLLRETQLLLHL